jgi:hypothetical protein
VIPRRIAFSLSLLSDICRAAFGKNRRQIPNGRAPFIADRVSIRTKVQACGYSVRARRNLTIQVANPGRSHRRIAVNKTDNKKKQRKQVFRKFFLKKVDTEAKMYFTFYKT